MQSLQSIKGMNRIKQKEIFRNACCVVCQRPIRRVEMVIPNGPNKGEVMTVDIGCKCKDIPFAEEAKKNRESLRAKKMKQHFDYYSLINQSLQQATFENYQPTSQELGIAKQAVIDYVDGFSGEKIFCSTVVTVLERVICP